MEFRHSVKFPNLPILPVKLFLILIFDFEYFITPTKNVICDWYQNTFKKLLATPQSNVYSLTRRPCCDDRSASTPTLSSTAFYHSQPVQPNPVAAAQSAGRQVGVTAAPPRHSRWRPRCRQRTTRAGASQGGHSNGEWTAGEGKGWGALWTRVGNEYLKK